MSKTMTEAAAGPDTAAADVRAALNELLDLVADAAAHDLLERAGVLAPSNVSAPAIPGATVHPGRGSAGAGVGGNDGHG